MIYPPRVYSMLLTDNKLVAGIASEVCKFAVFIFFTVDLICLN